MTKTQKTAKSHFGYYSKFRDEEGSHAVYIMRNDIDQDANVAILLREMYNLWIDENPTVFYGRYPFMVRKKRVIKRIHTKEDDRRYETLIKDMIRILGDYKKKQKNRKVVAKRKSR